VGLPDDTDLEPEQLLALDPPEQPVLLHCEAKVAVELPDKAITLMVSLAAKGAAGSGDDSAVSVGAPVSIDTVGAEHSCLKGVATMYTGSASPAR
jgi:hypothetical protein